MKRLERLSRDSLISLALDWLDESAIQNAIPYLRRSEEDDYEDMDDLYPACQSLEQLRQEWEDMRQHKGSKRDVVSRILSGDWRHGLTLYQLAMADFAYLEERPTSQTWSAYQILPLQQPNKDAGDDEVLKVDRQSLKIPRFHPATFLQNLQEQVLPDVKAHYQFYQPESYPILLLRIFVVDSPFNSEQALSGIDSTGTTTNFDSSRTIYLAFPNGSPHLYITRPQTMGPTALGESRSIHDLVVNGVPKALSRPRERFTVQSTRLQSKNLWAILEQKGAGRSNAAAGGWSIYADEKTKKSPLDSTLPTPPLSEVSKFNQSRKRKTALNQAQRERKRAKLIAHGRFGSSAQVGDGKGVERVEVVVQDPFPPANTVEESDDDEDQEQPRAKRRKSKVDATLQKAAEDLNDNAEETALSENWTPSVKLSFTGSHVFAGIRQLVEAGIVDGQRMPGWMTGEEGVTTGVVRHGRIRGHKGSGV